MNSTLPLSLLAFFIGSAVYLAPIRQKAVWFNKCVEWGMKESKGYTKASRREYEEAMAIAVCNGK